jgi:carbon-monoxide dehydrogenase medium subunit
MYPPRFRYEAPRSLDEAIGLLHEGGGEAKVLAGGQSLIPLLKLRFAAPGTVGRHQSHPCPRIPPGRC